jgi:predicted metal-dependent phosphoesterase TrpH
MTAVDMHFHSIYSDSYTKIDRILSSAAKLGIGIAITDHNEIKGAIEACKKSDDVLVIPGIEVACYERCHFLLYFPKVTDLKQFYYTAVEPYKSKNPYTVTKVGTEKLLNLAMNYDCLKFAAHPFGFGFTGLHRNIKRGYVKSAIVSKLDGLEVINGVNLRKMNWKSLEWAEKLGKCFTGGSDGHSLYQLGKVITYGKARTASGFLNAIRDQENFVIGKEMGFVRQVPSNSRMLRRHFRYIPPTLRLRYEVSIKPSMKYHVPRMTKKLNHAKDIGIERVRDIGRRSRRRIDYRFERI